MHQRQPRSDARPLLRSLVQKAVRRGDAQLAETVACRLAEQGDSEWLGTRTGVIAFEECWQYGTRLLQNPPLVALCEIARMRKNKEAAGLGSLAHAVAGGDFSALDAAPDPVAVKIVAASLTRTNEFFSWAARTCQGEEQGRLLEAARMYFPRASWPWDKAFASAAAYFASCGASLGLEPVPMAIAQVAQCPLWVAVDKHTPIGKLALRRTASKIQVPIDQLEWASFYFESAFCNERISGAWWQAEMAWRLQKVRLKVAEAEAMWDAARDCMQREVSEGVEVLEAVLAPPR